jgi:hypothetical protein
MQSAKKRQRDELDLDDDLSTGSKDTKRRNTSKTPVKLHKTITSKTPSTENGSTTTATRPEVNAAALDKFVESHENLLIPPPRTSTRSRAEKVHEKSPKETKKSGPVTRAPETASERSLDEVGARVAVSAVDTHSLKRWVAGLAVLLLLATGMAVFLYASSQIAVTGLKQELTNCQATQSEGALEDGHYIQELQTQVRAWKQNFKAKEVELEALRNECFLSSK